jgi:hypothetical protein
MNIYVETTGNRVWLNCKLKIQLPCNRGYDNRLLRSRVTNKCLQRRNWLLRLRQRQHIIASKCEKKSRQWKTHNRPLLIPDTLNSLYANFREFRWSYQTKNAWLIFVIMYMYGVRCCTRNLSTSIFTRNHKNHK